MRRRRIAAVALLLAFCAGVVVTRAMWEGRAALSRGDEAAEAGDTAGAIRWWRRAARWYLPGAPHVDGAYERLETLAAAAEERGDTPTALAAWRAVRGSILATRWLVVPHEERLDPANQRIAALMAQVEGGAGEARAGAEAFHLELLRRDESPSVGWVLVALLGFSLWVGGGLAFARRAVDAEDRLVPRAAAYAGAAIALGLVIWLLGLYQA